MTGKRFGLLFRAVPGLPVFGVCLLLWSGFAVAAEDHPVRHGEGRLWKIERDDTPPSHIMGTIHITDPRVRDLPPEIRRAFENSEQAAFELLFHPEEREKTARAQRLPKRTSLVKLLDKETYEKVVELAAAYGIPARAVETMQPWALAFTFQVSPEEFRRRLDGDLILDLWLIQWAYDLGMRVVALEKVEEQIAAFEAVQGESDPAEILHQVLAQLEENPDGHAELLEQYLAGDMRTAYRQVEEMAASDAEPDAQVFKEVFLDARNHTMVKRMLPLLKRGKAFIAVGALHMPGEEGILHLLEQRGYRVTRVY